MKKTGLLLINIGSPETYDVNDVKKYLKTFLMDKDVLSIPFLIRWLLVHGIIVPRRAAFSAEKYKKIWFDGKGSPLTVYTQKFEHQLQQALGEKYLVKTGMRYSEPSIENALKEMAAAQVDKIILAPLYPQNAEATTGSSVKEVQRLLQHLGITLPTKILPPFFKEKSFIESFADQIKKTLGQRQPQHFLFSFHGLPESHVRKVAGCLTTENCCFEQNACAKGCYRAQCFSTADHLAQNLGLTKQQWSVSFQSRLGPTAWLKPSTDEVLTSLAQSGQKTVAVACPAFVTDCLETLEEIGLEGQQQFKENGGKEFILIPCPNDEPAWTTRFAELIQKL